jgi:1-acyl-sn-glycerol-3-phosphate acyltransferase
VPCLPVALNSGLFWPRRSLVHRRGTVLVEVLPAIPPGLEAEMFKEMLQERIEGATAGLIAESFSRHPGLKMEAERS